MRILKLNQLNIQSWNVAVGYIDRVPLKPYINFKQITFHFVYALKTSVFKDPCSPFLLLPLEPTGHSPSPRITSAVTLIPSFDNACKMTSWRCYVAWSVSKKIQLCTTLVDSKSLVECLLHFFLNNIVSWIIPLAWHQICLAQPQCIGHGHAESIVLAWTLKVKALTFFR